MQSEAGVPSCSRVDISVCFFQSKKFERDKIWSLLKATYKTLILLAHIFNIESCLQFNFVA